MRGDPYKSKTPSPLKLSGVPGHGALTVEGNTILVFAGLFREPGFRRGCLVINTVSERGDEVVRVSFFVGCSLSPVPGASFG